MKAEYVEGKLVKFTASDKIRLHGFLVGKNRREKCLIYLHGMGGNFYSNSISKSVALAVSRHGCDVFIINTRGHDVESRSHTVAGKNSKRVTIGTRYEKFEESVHDIKGAISAMRSMGYKNFYLCGHSTGCQKILYYKYKTNDSRVKSLVLLAPDDDYNLNRKEYKKKWKGMVSAAKKLVKMNRGNIYAPGMVFSPQRFLSIADLSRVESRLFNYDGELREFRSIKIPIFVVFGTKDEGAVKPVKTYIQILRRNTNSKSFGSLVINGANHSFLDHESEVGNAVARWLGHCD